MFESLRSSRGFALFLQQGDPAFVARSASSPFRPFCQILHNMEQLAPQLYSRTIGYGNLCPASLSFCNSPLTVTMPATRSKSTVRSQSVPLLAPRGRSIPRPPMYHSTFPIALPLPVIRATLVYAEDNELPDVVLHRPLPRPTPEPPSFRHTVKPRRVSIKSRDVTPARVVSVRSPPSSESPRRVRIRPASPPPASPLTEISDESETASMDVDRDEVDDSHEVLEPTIAKPPGEAGRPESGGYNLEVAVKLGPYEFLQIKVSLQSLCNLYVSQPLL